jgi:cytochrome b subunit of formate dehydrogenase
MQRRHQEEQLTRDAARSQATAPVPDLPKYTALEVTSTLLRAFAWVYGIISGVALLIGLFGILSEQFAVTILLFGAVMVGFLAALLLFGLAQLLAAIRDRAMNSWKQVILLQDVRERAAAGAHPARQEGPAPTP